MPSAWLCVWRNLLQIKYCTFKRIYANRTHDPITARKFNSWNCLCSIYSTEGHCLWLFSVNSISTVALLWGYCTCSNHVRHVKTMPSAKYLINRSGSLDLVLSLSLDSLLTKLRVVLHSWGLLTQVHHRYDTINSRYLSLCKALYCSITMQHLINGSNSLPGIVLTLIVCKPDWKLLFFFFLLVFY